MNITRNTGFSSIRSWLAAAAVAAAQIAGLSSWGQTNVVRTGRFYRGTGTDTTFQSFVLPLDFQKGVALDNLYGNVTNLFPGAGTNAVFGATRYHYDATQPASSTNVALRIPYNNPIVAFGGRVGGTPLYYNQDYHFGVYAGVTDPSTIALYVVVYTASDHQRVDSVAFPVPSLLDTNSWRSFVTNGYQVSLTTYGLTTTLRFDDPYSMWGVSYIEGCYHLIHNATATATNYLYDIILMGYKDNAWMTVDANGVNAWGRMYTLEFQQRPPWRAVVLDQPQFAGTPAPSFYEGKSLPELLTNAPVVTNAVSLTPSACTNLDASPELRRHPVLDQFVLDMRRDPLALANYVQNEIELTDALAYNDNGAVSDISINLGGVNRSALGTYMEKQGSPTEQCALLVYLLRQAGVPAVYVFPAENGLKLLDSQLSKLLRMQIHGAINFSSGSNDVAYTTNSLIPVNYPWVAAYIGTNWVHLYPWLKDTEVVEGFNLYNYLPANYKTSYQWVKDYLYGKTNIMSLSSNDDTPQTLFPLFVKQLLATNSPGISLDDIGVQIVNRRHLYARWQDFPRPPVVTNSSIAIESLGSTTITNVNPLLTNIFDTVSVTVSSDADPTKKLVTGDLRTVDLHNRKFLIRHEKISSTSHRLIMTLEPYRTGTNGTGAFTNDTALLKQQSVTNTLAATDDSLTVQFVFHRHRSLPTGFVAPGHTTTYLGLTEWTATTNSRPLRKGDLGAICLNYGRVTPQMLQVHAQELWNMESTLRANPSATNTLSPDVFQGTVAYLMGMAYHEKLGRFDMVNQHLHKVQVASQITFGLAGLRAARTGGVLPSGNIDLVQPFVDMFNREVVIAGNTTIHLDSGDDGNVPNDDYFHLAVADGSAQEHSIINHYFRQTDAVSTVKLLQLAQARSATNGQPGMLVLDYYNYLSEGAKNYPTTGTVKLRDQSPAIWSRITNSFGSYYSADQNYVQVFITPGPVTNQSASFKGMGALTIEPAGAVAAIAEQNGGWGANNPANSLDLGNSPNISLTVDANNNYSVGLTPAGAGNITVAPDTYAGYNAGTIANNASANYYRYSPYQTAWTGDSMDYLGLGSLGSQNQDFSQGVQAASGNNGLLGWLSDALSQRASAIADPVHTVTGEFFVNATDLTLAGPMPLSVGRNYSSLNLADNEFGYGWKLNFMPYLSLNSGGTVIFAAEPDGSVLAYQQTGTNANVFLPSPALNPQLNNNRNAGIGSVANRMRNRIEKVSGADTFYYLYPPAGGKRTFKVMAFTGGNYNRTRPYLTTWEDASGNSFSFEYGTDSTQPDYAEVRRIQSSNGNYLGFEFDVYGHLLAAYAGDGRWTEYEYDEFGDLVTVTLPDEAVMQYEYEHKTLSITNGSTVTNATYSTHLILAEDKPDGRMLKNEYDQHRRVTNQWATVGADLTLVRSATFIYSNNFNLTNSYTNTITGYTLVKDALNHTNRYDYASGLITNMVDALSQTNAQFWYADNATAPGYPRSLWRTKDKRGLWSEFQYDSNGNVTNTVTWGDLTGDGTTHYATNTVAYDANNLPTLTTDPVGNQVRTLYHAQYPFLPEYVIVYGGGTPTVTNKMAYGNVTNTFSSGGVSYTNTAFGVLLQQIRAFNSPDAATNEWTRDGRGFITQSTRYTGTGDPAVVNTFFYNDRGQLVEQDDSAGRATVLDFDAMGRPTSREVFEAGAATPLSWDYSYYNGNGELTWSDGPRYNPEDYVYRDYDGAGRVTTETHWRSQGNPDGSGVSAAPGDAQYATTYYQYDLLGNLTNAVDPLGDYVVQSFDAANQLTRQVYYSSNGVAVATIGFAHEPGGLISAQTNALGGVTFKYYTTDGKLKRQVNPDGSTNSWTFDLSGRLVNQVLANTNYWQTTYNDAQLSVVKVFHNATTTLATNMTQMDRRGNVIQTTDAEGNVFNTTFDGLDRIRVSAGPQMLDVGLNMDLKTYSTNITQQIQTRFYDASGQVLVVSNTLGERTITTSDALGRPTQVAYYPTNSTTAAHVISTFYSPDHNSVTVTNGTGASAMVTTTFTDTEGRPVLSIGYPTNGVLEYVWQQYDLGGRRIARQQLSKSGGQVSTWATNGWTYDALNQVRTETSKDGVVITYNRDALGDVTNRAMPNGLAWSATYYNDGRIATEQESGGGLTTRSTSYSYYSGSSPYVGLLQSKTDGRSTTRSYSYDDFLRVTNLTTTGTAPEQQTTTTYEYDRRNLVTSIAQWFSTNSTGPDSYVWREFDSYGELTREMVSVANEDLSDTVQMWDAAGRRTMLDFAWQNYGFRYQADSQMTAADGSTFAYADNGLMLSRSNNYRTYFITQRDGAGRVLQTQTKVGPTTNLTESLAWRNDGKLSAYTAVRSGDFTNNSSYTYAPYSQRLTQEIFNVSASQRFTNNYTFDSAQASGLGVLTAVSTPAQSSNTWAISGGGLDGLKRVSSEQTAILRRPATGLGLGAATVSATLDGNPVNVEFDGKDAEGRWRAMLDLTAGSHTLRLAAQHPSGLYTAYATNTFTATNAQDTVTNAFDANGNVTKRVWIGPNGQTNRTQVFTWDAFDRLIKVSDRDTVGSGQDWVGIFDGLGRKVETISTLVVSNALMTTPASAVSVVDSWFDPEVEFQEVGIVINGGVFNMKTYGPDANGVHGGLQGVGGLERVTPFGHMFGIGLLQDFFGNVVGSVTNAANGVTWNPARFSSYGPVPGYQQPALTINANLAQSVGWRGKHIEPMGFFYWATRPLVDGRFLSHDPVLDLDNPGPFSFYLDPDPRRFDADARCLETAWNFSAGGVKGFSQGYFGIDVSRPANEPEYYGQQFGRSSAAAVAAWLTAKGTIDTGTGLGIMGGSLAVEVGSAGTATIGAGPAFGLGAKQAVLGVVEGAVGGWGLYNYNQLTPLNQPGGAKWVDENASMSPEARQYNDSAPGARGSVETRSPQAPELYYVSDAGETRAVRFDGQEGNVMIDRKSGVATTEKSVNQARRQSEALSQNDLSGRWEVPDSRSAQRAQRVLDKAGVSNIEVKVVPR